MDTSPIAAKVYSSLSRNYAKLSKLCGPPKTKREPSKYNIFMKTNIAKIKAENPGKTVQETMKILGDRWQAHKAAESVEEATPILNTKEVDWREELDKAEEAVEDAEEATLKEAIEERRAARKAERRAARKEMMAQSLERMKAMRKAAH